MKQGEWIVLTQYSCGCQVRKIRDKITKTFIVITYCPKHKAAPDMYEALEAFPNTSSTMKAEEYSDLVRSWLANYRYKALAKAKGQEGR